MRFVYGINPVREAIAVHPEDVKCVKIASGRRGRDVDEIVSYAQRLKIPVVYLPKQSFDRPAKTSKHQGIIAELKRFRYAEIDDIIDRWKASGKKALILVLDSIQDPHNLGAIIRTASCAGVNGVIIQKDRAVAITPAVVKASAGAVESVPIVMATNLRQAVERLKKEGVWVAGMDSEADKSIYETDLNMDIALVIGSEGKGIRPLLMKNCDFLVSIPLSGRVTSLNASVAGGVALFEIVRQRL